MEITDANNHRKYWEQVRNKEFKTGRIDGLSKHNSSLAIDLLKDFQNGFNTTTKGKRTPQSLLRVRNGFKSLGTETKKDFDKLTKEELKKICDKKNNESFAKNIKVIFAWMYRTERIKRNIAEFIVTNEYSGGKPKWVYLNETQMKDLINSADFGYRALLSFFFDSGIRPSEAWKIRISDFQDDFTILNIPEKRDNKEKVSKTFDRTIKLKLCTSLLKDYVKFKDLKGDDLLITVGQAGFNKMLKKHAKKLFGTNTTKGKESPDHMTATDLRHCSACFWLIRYKTDRDLMYRFGWKQQNKIYYYTEFLNLRDKIEDEDMITTEDKNKYEQEIERLKNENSHFKEEIKEIKNIIHVLNK